MLEETVDRITEVEDIEEIALKRKMTRDEKWLFFVRWRDTPHLKLKYPSLNKLSEFLELSYETMKAWNKKVEKQMPELNSQELMKRIIEDSLRPGADVNTRKLGAQVLGILNKGNEENTFEPTAEHFAVWTTELIRRLKSNWIKSGGVCPVCSGHQVLFSEIRLPAEQEHSPDGEVADVAVSGGLDRHLPDAQGDSDTQS